MAESTKIMGKTESRLDSLELHVANMGATLKFLEVQMGQLTNAIKDQQKITFPRNAEKFFREVNAIFVQHEEKEVIGEQFGRLNLQQAKATQILALSKEVRKVRKIFQFMMLIFINFPILKGLCN